MYHLHSCVHSAFIYIIYTLSIRWCWFENQTQFGKYLFENEVVKFDVICPNILNFATKRILFFDHASKIFKNILYFQLLLGLQKIDLFYACHIVNKKKVILST